MSAVPGSSDPQTPCRTRTRTRNLPSRPRATAHRRSGPGSPQDQALRDRLHIPGFVISDDQFPVTAPPEVAFPLRGTGGRSESLDHGFAGCTGPDIAPDQGAFVISGGLAGRQWKATEQDAEGKTTVHGNGGNTDRKKGGGIVAPALSRPGMNPADQRRDLSRRRARRSRARCGSCDGRVRARHCGRVRGTCGDQTPWVWWRALRGSPRSWPCGDRYRC